MPKPKEDPRKMAHIVRPGKSALPNGQVLEGEVKQRSFLEYPRTRAACEFLSSRPEGLNKTQLINHLLQQYALEKGWNPGDIEEL